MMWPPVLDMTRDECRGVLRRLELETYSNIVSTFRAQGGLSDAKIKLLEELRIVFHISTDRHRAEARRVANDEQLCTIAETISGPNTTQEWSREGRRSFPLLPRSAPYTALSAVANGVSEIVKNENAKLPYPSETERIAKLSESETVEDAKQVVQQDPALIIAEEKRNLKRQANQIPDTTVPTSPISKKRTISGSVESTQQSPLHLHTNTKIQQLYHNHSKTQSRHKKGSMPKRGVGSTVKSTGKPPATPHQVQPKVHNVPKTPKPPEVPAIPANKNSTSLSRNLHTYASMPPTVAQYDNAASVEKSGKLIVEPSEATGSNNWPQIATSKKDITNNLSKLNMMSNTQVHTTPGQVIADSGKSETPVSPTIFSSDGRAVVNNIASTNQMSWAGKSHVTATAIPGQRPLKTPNANIGVAKPISSSNKQMQQSQHLPSPNSSAISLTSGYISIGQKVLKPENAVVLNISERKESEVSNANIVAGTAFIRQDSIPATESGKLTSIIGTGNFDLKTNTESAPAAVGSVAPGTKPKIQIHSNQTISPGYGSLKFPAGVQLKNVAGRKTVQIYSSPSGKMFIQSADGSKSQSGSASGSGIVSTTASRYALQKVQIVPSPSGKPLSLNKSDMILMPGGVLAPAASTGNLVVRNLPLMKQNKRLSTGPMVTKPVLSDLSGSGVMKNQNVIVIGSVTPEKIIKDTGKKSLNEANMITEDTPVDILTTPISNIDNAIQVATPAISKEIKSPITVLQTVAPGMSEDTNKRIIVQDHKSTRVTASSRPLQQHMQMHSAEILTSTSGKISRMDSDSSYIVSSTDWEVELDQQAANKNRTNQTIIIQEQQLQSGDVSSAITNLDDDDCRDDIDASHQIIDNFHDVIEEDTIDDDSLINETTEGEDEVEFDVSYGTGQDDLDENVAIEYVDDAGTSSDAMIEDYSEIIRSDTDDNEKSYTSKMLPSSQAHTIIYSTNSRFKGKLAQSSESSSSVIYEIDENGLNQINR